MRKLLLLLLALPFIGVAQTKNVLSVSRYFPKVGKEQQFEKAVAAHAQKYHKGDNHWRVYYIESGPDAGGYHVVEGPKNWDAVDKRGNLGEAHTMDWDKTVQPLLMDHFSTRFVTYREDLSTVAMGNYSDKIAINHIAIKPGYYAEMLANLQGMKKMWEAEGSTIAVYETALSGEPEIAVVTRYKSGLKERDAVATGTMPARFASANGAGSWEKYIAVIKNGVSKQWSELLTLKPEMGSK